MNVVVSGAFWKASLERALKTFLQTYFAVFLVGDVTLNVFEWSWSGPELGIALGATALSFVTSLLSSLGGNSGPSLANEVALSKDAPAPR
jgi:uncharacterized integral membrane protein